MRRFPAFVTGFIFLLGGAAAVAGTQEHSRPKFVETGDMHKAEPLLYGRTLGSWLDDTDDYRPADIRSRALCVVGKQADPRHLDIMSKAIESKDPVILKSTIYALSNYRTTKSEELLLSLTSPLSVFTVSSDPEIRRLSLIALSRISPARTRAQVSEILGRNPATAERVNLACVLGYLKDQGVTELLTSLAANTSPDVRRAAIYSLYLTPGSEAAEAFASHSTDPAICEKDCSAPADQHIAIAVERLKKSGVCQVQFPVEICPLVRERKQVP